MRMAQTIDGVIARLEAIIHDCVVRNDRMGYFPALYNRVTRAVRDAIQQGQFQDGLRMERLDVVFANRYLTAYDEYRNGQRPTASWQQAFETTKNDRHIILQDLLIGMNAHIDLDLGIAAAEVCPGNAIDGLKNDFDKINQILFQQIPTVTQQIGNVSPEFQELVNVLPFHGEVLAGLSITVLRDFAWKLAKSLAPANAFERMLLIGARDLEVDALGVPILVDWPIIQMIKREESTDVARNIRVLAAGEFVYTVKA